jgi:hypothetical protein
LAAFGLPRCHFHTLSWLVQLLVVAATVAPMGTLGGGGPGCGRPELARLGVMFPRRKLPGRRSNFELTRTVGKARARDIE